MRRALLTILPLSLLLAGPAVAGELREPIMDLLNAYEGAPTAAQLTALGDGVADELMDIAADSDVASSRRGRAVSALGDFPSDDTLAFLSKQLGDTDASSILRRKAAYALAAGWGEQAVKPLSDALSDSDVQLRIAAAGALADVSGDAAKGALNARLEAEDSDAAREAIEKALGDKR